MSDEQGSTPDSSSGGLGVEALERDDSHDDASAPSRRSRRGKEPKAPKPPKKKMNPIAEWTLVVLVAISSALLVRAFVVQQFAVEGESMLSTLHDGDRVLVNRLSYRLHDPRRGDVVVLKRFDTGTTERDLIKRVIGLPGETVEIRNCVVYIDNRPMTEPYIDPIIQQRDGCGGEQPATLVPDGQVFVLGDHRGRSSDSRVFGPVSYEMLIGRAFVIIWPVGDWAWL
jgi:signal peptidase I